MASLISMQKRLNRFSAGILLSLALLVPSEALMAEDLQQIVSGFYPKSLVDAAASANQADTMQRLSAFAAYDQNTIVAAYSNGILGDVLVLKRGTDGQYKVAYEPANLEFAGSDCEVSLLDVDGDGTNEVIVSFSSLRGNTIDWVFKWDGTVLKSIGPTSPPPDGTSMDSVAMNSEFIDFYHDGTLQMVVVGENPPPLDGSPLTTPDTLYRLTGGTFQPIATLNFFDTFVRADGAPTMDSRSFTIDNPNTAYVMRIANGDGQGGKQVSSAEIYVNGQQVVSPSAFSQGVPTLTVPISVASSNTISVNLKSTPGSELTIGIGPQ
jgi:hypothetical protein